jgi:dolichol-phosphate mannosyltransferase
VPAPDLTSHAFDWQQLARLFGKGRHRPGAVRYNDGSHREAPLRAGARGNSTTGGLQNIGLLDGPAAEFRRRRPGPERPFARPSQFGGERSQSLKADATMDPNEQSGEFLIESETNLQAEGSTLAGMGPRSLTPSLELVMLLVPVTDQAARVAPFLHTIESRVEPPFGVMLVYERDDAATLAIGMEFRRSRPWLDLVPNTAEPGLAGAVRTGFVAIGHGPVVVMRISGADDPNDISRMRRLYAEGHRIVAASRDLPGSLRRGDSRLGRWLGRTVNRILRRTGGLPLHDPTNSYRLYDAALVNKLRIESRRGADVSLELATKAITSGESIIEIPTTSTAGDGRAEAWGLFTRAPRWFRWCRRARRRDQSTPRPVSLHLRTSATPPPALDPKGPEDAPS